MNHIPGMKKDEIVDGLKQIKSEYYGLFYQPEHPRMLTAEGAQILDEAIRIVEKYGDSTYKIQYMKCKNCEDEFLVGRECKCGKCGYWHPIPKWEERPVRRD